MSNLPVSIARGQKLFDHHVLMECKGLGRSNVMKSGRNVTNASRLAEGATATNPEHRRLVIMPPREPYYLPMVHGQPNLYRRLFGPQILNMR